MTCPFRFSSFMMGAASNYNQPRVRPSVPETSKVPIAPMGKCLLTCPKRFSSFNWDQSCSTRDKYVPVTPAKVPIAPMGKLLTHFLFDSRLHNCKSCLQGGGVYVSSGTVTISSCTISGNTAGDVRARCAHAQMFPSPRWETHVLLVVCREAVSLSPVAQ